MSFTAWNWSFIESHPLFKYGVEKHFSFQEDLPPVHGHYLDFSQSFRNLLENALEAMEGAARRRLTVVTAFAGGQRLLQLGDTGPGIPPEVAPGSSSPSLPPRGTGKTTMPAWGCLRPGVCWLPTAAKFGWTASRGRPG